MWLQIRPRTEKNVARKMIRFAVVKVTITGQSKHRVLYSFPAYRPVACKQRLQNLTPSKNSKNLTHVLRYCANQW